jgi:RNA recognition motif-containing protein
VDLPPKRPLTTDPRAEYAFLRYFAHRFVFACCPSLSLRVVPDAAFGQSQPSRSSRNPSGQASAGLSTFFEDFLLTKLYVGNLPFSATEDSVRTLFAEHGNVEKVALVNDRDTGQPRGFGFVEMSSSDAQKAMQSLNGKDFGGRPLKVNEAQDKPRGGGGGGGGGGYGRR